MIQQLPIDASDHNYRVATTLEGIPVVFDVRWNGRDEAWYFDLLTIDEVPIISGVKIVLGTLLGRKAKTEDRLPGRLIAADLSGEGREATIDDLGTRVIVYYFPQEDL